MSIQKKEIEIAKELDDVFALVVQIVMDAKAKKSAAEIASASIPKLIDAISGIDQVPVELKASKAVAINTAMMGVGKIVSVLLPEEAP